VVARLYSHLTIRPCRPVPVSGDGHPDWPYAGDMRQRLQNQLPSVLALTLVTLLIAPIASLASSGLPATVTMYPESAGPGEVVEVTGLDFPAEAAVELKLTTSASTVPLIGVTTSLDGSFRELVTLPADAPPGVWELNATAPGGVVAAHAFDTTGMMDAAALAEADPATDATAETTAGSGNSIGDIAFMLVIAGVLGAISIAGMFAWLQVRADGPQPGMGAGSDLIWSGSESDAAPELTASEEPHWKAAQGESSPASRSS